MIRYRWIAVTVAVAAVVFAAPAGAAPDPHMPDPTIGWCPGGGTGGFGYGYCDGVKYPDGSYWHQIRGGIPFVGFTNLISCVIDDGSAVPPPAPHGGCGGAV